MRVNWHQRVAIGVAVLTAALAARSEAQRATAPTGVTHIITIRAGSIEPASLTARPGDTVVWSNATSWNEAMVLFEKGSEVALACVAPVGFFLTASGVYTSGLIAPGGVASLCFVEPGTYEYRVNQTRSDKSFLYAGRIVVR
jgi:plastocyanin